MSVRQKVRLSDVLYEIYSKIHYVSSLTIREHQILYMLNQDPLLDNEHRDMIRRIAYKLNRQHRHPVEE